MKQYAEGRGTGHLSFRTLVLAAMAVLPLPAAAQHEGHERTPPPARHHEPPAESTRRLQSDMASMTGMTPEAGLMEEHEPGWQTMILGAARLQLNRQDGASGENSFESTNRNMMMAGRSLGEGRLTLMLMNSLEPTTMTLRLVPTIFASCPWVRRALFLSSQMRRAISGKAPAFLTGAFPRLREP